jgi:hypothetical protein
MRNWKAFAFAAVASTLLAGSLQAQTATGLMKWMGVNGAWGSYNVDGPGHPATANVYTSPYRAQFQIPSNPSPALLPPAGSTGFGSTWDIYCVDFNHYANTGTSSVWFTNLGTDSEVLGTYTRDGDRQKYLAAAYLAERIKARPDSAGLLNGAIWRIMSGTPQFWRDGSNNWVDVQATADFAYNTGWMTVNASNWVVVTEYTTDTKDVNGRPVLGSHQEFITHVTPEPATLLLLGTGLLATLMAAGALRRSAV